MFTHILVALDGSDLAEQALPMAQDLARSSNATIHLIQVISRQPELQAARGGGDYSLQAVEMDRDLARQLVEGRLSRGKEYLEGIASQLKKAELKVETTILEGAAGENIVDYSSEHGVDLIVIMSCMPPINCTEFASAAISLSAASFSDPNKDVALSKLTNFSFTCLRIDMSLHDPTISTVLPASSWMTFNSSLTQR